MTQTKIKTNLKIERAQSHVTTKRGARDHKKNQVELKIASVRDPSNPKGREKSLRNSPLKLTIQFMWHRFRSQKVGGVERKPKQNAQTLVYR